MNKVIEVNAVGSGKFEVYTNGKTYSNGDQYFTVTELNPRFKKAMTEKVVWNHELKDFHKGGPFNKGIMEAYGFSY